MRDKSCEGCAHYDETASECHKYAPRAVEGIGYWPKVKPDDWCSEFVDAANVYKSKKVQK